MQTKMIQKQNLRKRRTMRVRKKLRGDQQRPRLCVVKSNRHIEAQVIDDEQGKTLFAVTTKAKEYQGSDNGRRCKTAAKTLGTRLAELAKEHQVQQLVFDRGSAKYHGVLAELADAARAGGLQF